jgi:hypothetical protein
VLVTVPRCLRQGVAGRVGAAQGMPMGVFGRGAQGGGPAGQPRKPVEPVGDEAVLAGQPGNRRERGGRGQVPGGGTGARQGAEPGRPEGQAVAEFGDSWEGRLGREQGADGVAHPDHAMGGPGGDAWQQARPPGRKHVAPWPLGELVGEVDCPVADAPAVAAEGLPPGRVRDRLGRSRQVCQPEDVAVQPSVHVDLKAAAADDLHHHRPMVSQPVVAAFVAAEFRAVAVQPLVRLAQDCGARRVHGNQADGQPLLAATIRLWPNLCS